MRHEAKWEPFKQADPGARSNYANPILGEFEPIHDLVNQSTEYSIKPGDHIVFK